ncbi:MAG TPA: thioredoxin-disulfide reductase [Clostridiales bacterium]|nr:thioredoxin-disulfide reductase [Clostridiales bacterium]
MYDCIIIGGGPAGMTAGIYLARGGMNALLLEKAFSGGQIALAHEVENYPGLEQPAGGMELAMRMERQAKKFGLEIKYEEVQEAGLTGPVKTAITARGAYQARALILCMGASPRKLDVTGEDRLAGLGVSYCATCDGSFFKGTDVMVVGGGDTATEDALYLSRICRKIYLVHRRDTFRAAHIISEKVQSTPNIEVIWNSVVQEIHGDMEVEAASLRNLKDGQTKKLEISALFVAIGQDPNTSLVEGKLKTNGGYIVTSENMETEIPGIYAAGDLRQKTLRQVVTACSDGAIAAAGVERCICLA